MTVNGSRLAALTAAVVTLALAAALVSTAVRSDGFDYADPFDPLPAPSAQGVQTEVGGAPDRQRRLDKFLEFVFRDIQGFWAATLERSGVDYVPATLVVFQRPLATACGTASAAVGPFYCPIDRRIYLDPGFFR